MMFFRFGRTILLLALPLASGGCYLANMEAERAKDPPPEHTYEGLANQSSAVMVYADWRTRVEYNRIQGDLAQALQQRLAAKLKDEEQGKKQKESGKTAEGGTQFLNPLSVVRYQREHPETEADPIEQVAPRLAVSRLIYVEVESFSVQSPGSIMILKGRGRANLRVLEIADGKARIVFEEAGIETTYPPDAPEGVVPSDKHNAATVYKGTLDRLADKLAARIEG